MKQQFQDIRTYKFNNPDTGRFEIFKHKYHIMVFNGKVETVYNTTFGDWGHSVKKSSDTFEYYSRKYNK